MEAIEGLVEYTNIRQKTRIELTKLDKDTKKPIEGAEFGLYTGADIYNDNKDLLIEKDTLIDTATSDAEGKVVFDANIPVSNYYIKELSAAPGYTFTNEVIDIDAKWNPDGREVVNHKETVYNEQTKVDITKKVKDTGEILEGAELTLYDMANQPVETWVTTGSAHRVLGLIPGETYTLKETSPAKGYATAKDVTFTVANRENNGRYAPQQIEMLDEPIVVVIRINEIDHDGVIRRLGDVQYHIEDENGEVVTVDGDPLRFTTANDEDVVIERIPAGKYKIVFDSVPNGYISPIEVEMVVKDTPEKQHFRVDIPMTMIEIIAIDKDTRRPLNKVKVDITTEDGTMIYETVPLPYVQEKVKQGKYTIHVVQGPSGYVPPDDVDIEVKNISDLQKFVIEMDHTKIKIRAIDKNNETPVDGVKVDIINKNGVIVEHDVPLEFAKEYVASGKYKIVVTKVPYGYITPEDTEIFVRQVAGWQIFDIPMDTVKASIRPVDAQTNKVVKGVKIILRAPDGSVHAKWTSKKGWQVFNPIKPGNYLIEVTKVPKGYNHPAIRQIKIENISDMQYFEIELTKKSGGSGGRGSSGGSGIGGGAGGSSVVKPQTGDNLDLNWLYLALGLIAILAGAGVLVIHRKKKRSNK